MLLHCGGICCLGLPPQRLLLSIVVLVDAPVQETLVYFQEIR